MYIARFLLAWLDYQIERTTPQTKAPSARARMNQFNDDIQSYVAQKLRGYDFKTKANDEQSRYILIKVWCNYYNKYPEMLDDDDVKSILELVRRIQADDLQVTGPSAPSVRAYARKLLTRQR